MKKMISGFPANMFLFGSVFTAGIMLGCKPEKGSEKNRISVSTAMLDSIKKASDSAYIKPYFTRDFAAAEYFVNKKDTTLTQIMKDKDAVIRQIIITKYKVRIFSAQYYSNGQLMARYGFDKFGQFDGYSEEFHENGYVKSTGMYKSGFHSGQWKNFDETGKLVSKHNYNENGQLVSTAKD